MVECTGRICTCTNAVPRPQLGSLPAEHIPLRGLQPPCTDNNHIHNTCSVLCAQRSTVVVWCQNNTQLRSSLLPLTNDLCVDAPRHSMKAYLTVKNLNRRRTSNSGLLSK